MSSPLEVPPPIDVKMQEKITHPEISIILPCFNEAASLSRLYKEIKRTLAPLGRTYELIFIDDGSTDATYFLLNKFFQEDPHVHLIRMRRNFGQTASLAAGFEFARGEVIISMDTDLQHDPHEIPNFLKKIDEGYDIVSGWRQKRVDSFFLRRLPSLVANRLIRWLSGVKLKDFGTTYKAYRKEVIKSIELGTDQHRFIPALAQRIGARITEIPISNIVRPHGKSNYSLWRVFSVALDIIMLKFLVSYARRPMQFFGKIGFLSLLPGLILSVYVTIEFYFKGVAIREHFGNLLLSVFLMLTGMLFIAIGMLAEINARIYQHTGPNLLYVVKDVVSRRENNLTAPTAVSPNTDTLLPSESADPSLAQ